MKKKKNKAQETHVVTPERGSVLAEETTNSLKLQATFITRVVIDHDEWTA